MASMGARNIAHKPQPAIPIQSATTRKRLRSASSMRRSIMRSSPCDDRRNSWIYGNSTSIHTSLPPNRRVGERHQETQFREKLRRQIRSRGRNEACTVPGGSAAEPPNRRRSPRETAELEAKAKHLQQIAPGQVPTRKPRAKHRATGKKPWICSIRGFDSSDRTAWNHNTACSVGLGSQRPCSQRTAKTVSRLPPT